MTPEHGREKKRVRVTYVQSVVSEVRKRSTVRLGMGFIFQLQVAIMSK